MFFCGLLFVGFSALSVFLFGATKVLLFFYICKKNASISLKKQKNVLNLLRKQSFIYNSMCFARIFSSKNIEADSANLLADSVVRNWQVGIDWVVGVSLLAISG